MYMHVMELEGRGKMQGWQEGLKRVGPPSFPSLAKSLLHPFQYFQMGEEDIPSLVSVLFSSIVIINHLANPFRVI